MQWCTACDRGVFYPRSFCPYCGAAGGTGRAGEAGGTLEWREASGRATVHAAVVEHRPEAAGAAFSNGEPYCIALVDLEEGVRMMTNIVGCPPGDVHSGMAVTVSWEPLSDGRQLALFRPAGDGGRRERCPRTSAPPPRRACCTRGGRPGSRTASRSITPHGDRTYGDLNAEINRLSRALRARGLRARRLHRA